MKNLDGHKKTRSPLQRRLEPDPDKAQQKEKDYIFHNCAIATSGQCCTLRAPGAY